MPSVYIPLLCALCVLCIESASAQGVTVSFTPQPLEVVKAVLGGQPKGLALYGVDLCGAGSSIEAVPFGKVARATEGKFLPVGPAVASLTLARARSRSHWARGLAGLELLALGTSVLVGVDVIKVAGAWRAAPALVMGASRLARDQIERENPPVVTLQFIEETTLVPAQGCVSRLMLGSYVRSLAPFTTAIPHALPKEEK